MASIDVLTPALLREALATTVESIETEPVGTGQVASSIRVTITYGEGASGPATVVAMAQRHGRHALEAVL
jgi:hypothetical protein